MISLHRAGLISTWDWVESVDPSGALGRAYPGAGAPGEGLMACWIPAWTKGGHCSHTGSGEVRNALLPLWRGWAAASRVWDGLWDSGQGLVIPIPWEWAPRVGLFATTMSKVAP